MARLEFLVKITLGNCYIANIVVVKVDGCAGKIDSLINQLLNKLSFQVLFKVSTEGQFTYDRN